MYQQLTNDMILLIGLPIGITVSVAVLIIMLSNLYDKFSTKKKPGPLKNTHKPMRMR